MFNRRSIKKSMKLWNRGARCECGRTTTDLGLRRPGRPRVASCAPSWIGMGLRLSRVQVEMESHGETRIWNQGACEKRRRDEEVVRADCPWRLH